MKREYVEDVLLRIGVPTGIKGFAYIADAMEIFDERGTNISVTKELYPEIARRRESTPNRVERAIRHSLEIARSVKGDCEFADYYIGFTHCANFNSLTMLYQRIKQEDCPNFQPKEEATSAKAESALNDDIRSIVRQELRRELQRFFAELTKRAT